MNFDYEYVTSASGEAAKSASVSPVIYIIAGIAATLVLAALVYFVIFFIKNRKHVKTVVKSNGNVFCFQCDNRYDASLGRCPYCNKKNIRKRISYGRYRN